MKPNDIGRRQFYEFQTEGKYKDIVLKSTFKPEMRKQLDDYFWVLFEGKESFDLIVSEYRNMYNNREWWGFQMLMEDWKDNPWLVKHLCKWHENIPDFVKNIEDKESNYE